MEAARGDVRRRRSTTPTGPGAGPTTPRSKKAFEAMKDPVGESSDPWVVEGLEAPAHGRLLEQAWFAACRGLGRNAVTPQDCPESVVYPKERGYDRHLQEAEGRRRTRPGVFVQMTGKRNIQPRLAKCSKPRTKSWRTAQTDVDPKEPRRTGSPPTAATSTA